MENNQTSDLNNAMDDFHAKMTPRFPLHHLLLLLLLLLSSREASGSHSACGRMEEAGQDVSGLVPGKL